ncbi:MAG: hypothetical protein KA886_00235 [Candidatus Cloacimonetes bacterium]|nr:hypothetical protein [Candidatus Cloacimonadota bacterium]
MRTKIILLLLLLLSMMSCKLTNNTPSNNLPDDTGSFDIVSGVSVVNSATALTLDYPYLFVSDGNARLTCVDVMTPWHIERISSLNFFNNSSDPILDLVRDSRNMIYAGMGNSGFFTLNTSNPYSLNVQSFNTDIKCKSLSIDENNGYGNLLAISGDSFWKIYEIIGAGQILQLSSQEFMSEKNYKKIHIDYPYMYLGSNFSVDIYDISNPFLPQLIKSETLYYFKDFKFVGDRMLVLTNNQLIFYDVSNPYYANLLTQYTFNISPTSFFCENGNLLISFDNKQMLHYVISDQYALTEISSIQFDHLVQDIEYYEGYYFLACRDYGVLCLQLDGY